METLASDALVDEVLERDGGFCRVDGPGCLLIAVTIVRRRPPPAGDDRADADAYVAACEACAEHVDRPDPA